MNKTAIKNFAVWARRKLISDITYKAGMLGITENGIAEKLPQSTNDLQFFDVGTKEYAEVSGNQIMQRNALISVIKEKSRDTRDFKEAFEYVVEEVAYTWFNRLIAIRFMEVNDYLPSGIRVLSSENRAKNEPDFVTTPFDTDLDFTPYEQDRVLQLKDENKLDELFRMLFIKQCNKLHDVLPELFESTDDYTELLLTISFTDKDGVVYHLVHDIVEEDFDVEKEGQVEIIGWLYQYYNIEPKDKVFANLKKNIKISKENIPAATQLFTPDWIVRYMVENSLGKLWIEGHPNDTMKSQWKYYLEEAEQEAQVVAQLELIRAEHKNLTPEGIKFIDPCMGSGHILVYAFDVFMQIYESYGYTQRDAAKSILSNNLYGLDIDYRAYQLSYFAVMMKARQYNRRILSENIKPNLFVIQESNKVTSDLIDFISDGNKIISADLATICNELRDAKEYGSILDITPVDFDGILSRIDAIAETYYDDIFLQNYQRKTLSVILPLIKQAKAMAQKYDVVVTNPPYMGAGGMSGTLSEYVKKHYPDTKSDLFAVCIEKGNKMVKAYGFNCMVTMQSWMFLSSFEKMRKNILATKTITNLMHMENMVMGIAFGTAVTCFRNGNIKNFKGTYNHITLKDLENNKPSVFPVKENRFAQVSSDNFSKIPGSPIAYWISEKVLKAFESELLDDYGYPKQGFATGNNDTFLRLWHEVSFNNIGYKMKSREEAEQSHKKWFPCNKGGTFRRWYGNNYYLANWQYDGREMIGFKGSVIRNPQFYFKIGMTWSSLSSGKLSMRYSPCGFLFESKGSVCFMKDEDNLFYILGLMNTEIVRNMLLVLSPTLDYHEGPLSRVPIIMDESNKSSVEELVKNNVNMCKLDWDSFETSWDFKKHPLV